MRKLRAQSRFRALSHRASAHTIGPASRLAATDDSMHALMVHDDTQHPGRGRGQILRIATMPGMAMSLDRFAPTTPVQVVDCRAIDGVALVVMASLRLAITRGSAWASGSPPKPVRPSRRRRNLRGVTRAADGPDLFVCAGLCAHMFDRARLAPM
jgi:hypothetical protein